MSAPATRDVEMEEAMALMSRRPFPSDRSPKRQARMRTSEWFYKDMYTHIASFLDDKGRAMMGRASKEVLSATQRVSPVKWVPWTHEVAGVHRKTNPALLTTKLTHVTVSRVEDIDDLPATVTHIRIEPLPSMWETTALEPLGRRRFPPNLVVIDCFHFKGVIEHLPPTLRVLRFGDDVPSIGVGVLPAGLHTLDMGWRYNNPIGVGVLPAGLHTLKLGERFDHPIGVGVLPVGLHTLELGRYFHQSLGAGVLPEGLHTLAFGYASFVNKTYVLPEGLHTLVVPGMDYVQRLTFPPRLHTLWCLSHGYFFNTRLPESLRELYLLGRNTGPIREGDLPPKLERLLIENYPKYDAIVMPASLQVLRVERSWTDARKWTLPAALRTLIVYPYADLTGLDTRAQVVRAKYSDSDGITFSNPDVFLGY